MRVLLPLLALASTLLTVPALAQPVRTVDLALTDPADGLVTRVYGAGGSGQYGVPVAGGHDVDGDGHNDVAVAFMTADPLSRNNAGQIALVFGDGTIGGTVDTAVAQSRVLSILGDQPSENTGNEIWMDDVTGDGLGDLLIARQNYSPTGRSGAGALTILAGGAATRDLANGLTALDLRAPAPGVALTHFLGPGIGSRLGIWMRTGDVTGDGVADVVVGADQASGGLIAHHGAVYVVRGGPHLAGAGELDLAILGTAPLAGRVARVRPPAGSSEYHLGGTCQIADLDGDGVGEVIAAATLNRAGAVLGPAGGPSPHGSGGAPDGSVFILWDDNFTIPWPAVHDFRTDTAPGTVTRIGGAPANGNFGEELLGLDDVDGDGTAELFIGDLVTDQSPLSNRVFSGAGWLFYDAPSLAGRDFDLDQAPADVRFSVLAGPDPSAIGGDTAAWGDFDRDGLADLVFCSPTSSPEGRIRAGVLHLLLGRRGGWPAFIDTAALPPPELLETIEIRGARGRIGSDEGDILCYSAAAGDIDGDGTADLLINEMEGNAPAGVDVGNLLVVSGQVVAPLFADGFESGSVTAWSGSVP